MNWSFNRSKTLILFDSRARSSTYTPTLMSSPSFFIFDSKDITICIDRYKTDFLEEFGDRFIPKSSSLFQSIKTFQYLTD